MERFEPDTPTLLLAADLMLRNPKTLPAEASVAEVREQLANSRVEMVLLADGRTFKGAVTHVSPDAAPDDRALDHADTDPQVVSPQAPADEAFERAAASPNRRVIVLDDDRNLLGLLCLKRDRSGFCGSSS
jgi:CBS domain-containing protein